MDTKYNKALIGNAKSLRNNMTNEERHLWFDFLRDYPVRFRRQAVLTKYIADFYCPDARLIIELDGSQHFEDEGMARDKVRTEFLEENGLKVIRIPDNLVNKHFKEVCEYIDTCVKNAMRK